MPYVTFHRFSAMCCILLSRRYQTWFLVVHSQSTLLDCTEIQKHIWSFSMSTTVLTLMFYKKKKKNHRNPVRPAAAHMVFTKGNTTGCDIPDDPEATYLRLLPSS